MPEAHESGDGQISGRVFWLLWLALIMASTTLVHQHHLTDILTGWLAGLVIRRLTGGRDRKTQLDLT